jgi:hypothetical protein
LQLLLHGYLVSIEAATTLIFRKQCCFFSVHLVAASAFDQANLNDKLSGADCSSLNVHIAQLCRERLAILDAVVEGGSTGAEELLFEHISAAAPLYCWLLRRPSSAIK